MWPAPFPGGPFVSRRFVVRSVVGAALLAAIVLPSAGATAQPCTAGPSAGGDWAAMSGDLAGTRHQASETTIDSEAAATLEPAWATKVSDGGSTGNLNSTPVVALGCVFVGTANGDIVALDADSGDEIWSTHYDVVAPGLGGGIVSAVVVEGSSVITMINESGDGANAGPYAVALDASTGAERWRSAPFDTYRTSYTNGSPLVVPSNGGSVVFAGWSPPEGDSFGQGGFVLLDAATGALVKKTFTIPLADQVDLDGDGMPDHAGGGIWAPPSYDAGTGFAFVGAGNTFSKTTEHLHTNSVLKIDLRDRASSTFGEIVGAYKGVPDQYAAELEFLRETHACDASDTGFVWPLDDPVCGQLDLDFGAPVNVFELGGRTLVAGLQKAGIVHVFDADTLAPVWDSVVGAPCAACNAAATAAGPTGIAGVSAPGGTAFNLDPATGELRWAVPIGDGAHFQGVSLANGVYYTLDNAGILHALDATTGDVLVRRPMSIDTKAPTAAFSSSGISIARNTVYVAASSGAGAQSGWVIAYRPRT